MSILASIISSGCLCNNFTHYILHRIIHANRRRRLRSFMVFIINILHDGRAEVRSDVQGSKMALLIGRCGSCGEAGGWHRGGEMVSGAVMERLRNGQWLQMIGGGGGGRQVQWRWEQQCYYFLLCGIFCVKQRRGGGGGLSHRNFFFYPTQRV